MPNYSFDRAQNFIWANARLLERRIFEALFLGGPREMVVTALTAYQNPDGGFGSALEPDKRDPHSQPVDFERALQMLDMVGGLTDPQVHKDLLPACDWLETVTTPEGGVPFAMPTARQYPHAPWWGVDDNPPASLNPTADLVGLLLKAGVRHPWIERASAYCWKAIEETETEQYHDLMPIISFLENTPDDRARAERELARIEERMRKPGMVAYEVDAHGYVKKPLDWSPTPGSYLRRLFDDATISAHLDALAARQLEDGSWPITWDPISPAVGIEWRGWTTIEALHTLRSFEAEK